ncbi:MAG: lipid kinase [Proteobacteria bacterium]|nr:MAG: lipid kinase [Pseudomonadota bacterium]
MARPKRVAVLVNPGSNRGGDERDRVLAAFERHGIVSVPVACPRAADALGAALRAAAPHADAFAVGGGDGTLHAALPALLAIARPLGVLPLGTANDFAASLGLPADVDAAVAVIAAGRSARVDLGAVNGRPYLNAASIGLGAEVTRHLTRERKQRLGALGYPLTALERWRASRPFAAKLRWDGGERVLRTRQISIANGPRQGGRVANPAGGLATGRLALACLTARSPWRALVAMLALRLGLGEQADGVVALEAPRFEVTTRRSLEISADGEIVGRTPAVFEAWPGALEVFVAEEAGA